MEAVLFIAALVCVLVGYIAARIEYTKKLNRIRRINIATEQANFHDAFGAGWDAAIASPLAVQAAYRKLFRTTA